MSNLTSWCTDAFQVPTEQFKMVDSSYTDFENIYNGNYRAAEFELILGSKLTQFERRVKDAVSQAVDRKVEEIKDHIKGETNSTFAEIINKDNKKPTRVSKEKVQKKC